MWPEAILEILSLCLKLNEYLLNNDSRIGFSVRPSQRRQGYTTDMVERISHLKTKKDQMSLMPCRLAEQDGISQMVTLFKDSFKDYPLMTFFNPKNGDKPSFVKAGLAIN